MKGKLEQFLNIMGIDEMRAKEGEEEPFEMPDLKQVRLKHRSSGEDVELVVH